MNPFRILTQPPYPNAAVGLARGAASVVSLDRSSRNSFRVRRAGFAILADGLLTPGFEDANIPAPDELAELLAELATTTGMGAEKNWSVCLPEATTRSTVLTIEGAPAAGAEMEEMIGWKIERAFHHPLDDLRVARRRLSADERGRARYFVTGTRLDVLAEYEAVFARLGWHAGLILPRHLGEAWWLMHNNGVGDDAGADDALLVSSHAEGFTAIVLRDNEPLLVRGATCEGDDCADELYRLLLFYRDRLAAHADAAGATDDDETATDANAAPAHRIGRVLIVGERIDEDTTRRVIADTLDYEPRFLRPEDFSLSIPTSDLRFDHIAAPAGLAALAK